MTLGPTQSPVEWVPSPIPGDKEAGRGVAYPPYLAPRLKTKYRYWSTLPLEVHSLL